MKIDYVISINIDGNSGKSKATKEKIDHLMKINSNTRIYSLNQSLIKKSKYFSMIFLEISYLFRVIFSKRKPDIIFTRSYFMVGTYLISKLYKTVLIREVHADFYDESKILFKNSKSKQLISKLYTKYTNWFNNRSDGLIFNNPILEEYFANNYLSHKVKTRTVHNGTDVNFFIPKDELVSKIKLGLETNKKYLLFLGSISKWHGVEYILDMFKHLQNYNSSYHLIIVGGSDEKYLEEIKNKYLDIKNLTFTGKVEKELAVDYINASEVCLLPVNDIRISPGSPLKLFDYAACGKAIITQKNVKGYSDLVDKNNLGLSCNFMDPIDSSKLINDFIRTLDKEYYQENNRAVALEKFDWGAIINEWIKFAFEISQDSEIMK